MHLLKASLVVTVVIILAVVTILPIAFCGPSTNIGQRSLRASPQGVLTADGGDPVPIPWFMAGSQSSEPGVLIADGGDPVPIPWRKIAA